MLATMTYKKRAAYVLCMRQKSIGTRSLNYSRFLLVLKCHAVIIWHGKALRFYHV